MSTELIEKGKFYAHNILRILPSPPLSYIDKETGLIVTKETDYHFSIQIRKKFSDTDLLDYYQRAFGCGNLHKDDVKQFCSALVYMVTRYGLDTVLFTIDYLRDLVASENVMPPAVPFDLQRYIPYGKEILERKKAREIKEKIGDWLKNESE
jgi:hypothetical protein